MSQSLKRHAEAHRAAAGALRAAEQQACQGLPDEARATCPLMALPVTAVENTPDGVRVTYAGAEPEALLRHARCHAAHGDVEGGEGMPGCPLYGAGLRMSTEPAPGGAVLILGTDDETLRGRLREIYVPAE